ncbi:hypothetical protein [uncultured Chloroflexus sp.]|uniref:hypothetical protein n=1 Tax=uncultured Chloroflexus sp. TaxID=214040 RepID=UPI00262750A7|nr:hypothetical protein [uncultured Chloroflexus sp.]
MRGESAAGAEVVVIGYTTNAANGVQVTVFIVGRDGNNDITISPNNHPLTTTTQ